MRRQQQHGFAILLRVNLNFGLVVAWLSTLQFGRAAHDTRLTTRRHTSRSGSVLELEFNQSNKGRAAAQSELIPKRCSKESSKLKTQDATVIGVII